MTQIPTNAVRRPDNHLAEGEHTGHFHDARGEGVAVYDLGDTMLLDAPNGSRIVHQEHNPFEIPAGRYERRIVREYDHFAEEARDVRD